MRAHGAVPEVAEVTASDHLCWLDEGDAALDTAVRSFLAGGLARGERLLCVGERVIGSLRGDPATLPDVDALLAAGTLETLTVSEAYDAHGEFTPERQLESYDAATRRALDDGYRGLRVVADVTAMAADETRRSALVRWEHLADQYVAQGPGMSAMCVYRGDLGDDVLTDAASAHPLVHAPEGLPPCRLFFADEAIQLAGSVDIFTAERLGQMLATSPVAGATVTLDLTLTEFIDVAGCRAIARWARDLDERSVALEVTGASRLVRRMWQILGLADVAPVGFRSATA